MKNKSGKSNETKCCEEKTEVKKAETKTYGFETDKAGAAGAEACKKEPDCAETGKAGACETKAPKKKGIICFDLDHTLLDNSTNEICASALSAIEKLRPSYHIVIASGRDMDNYYSAHFRDQVSPDAVIHQNGTKITIGKELYRIHLMEPELVKKIVEYAEKNGLSVGTTIDGEDYFTHPELKREADRSYNKFLERNFRPADELHKLPVRALYFSGRCDEDNERFLKAFPMMKLLTFSSGRGADLVEKGYSKADGLKCLCEYYGVDIKDTYAFGDSMNDIDIVKAAGMGVAVGNAVDELKAVADFVAEDIREDGIYKACVSLGLIEG